MPNKYARLEDFDTIIKHLMRDPKTEPLDLTCGQLTATLSLLLRVYVLPDMEPAAKPMVLELARTYADELIRRYPFCEGYVDYLFGITLFPNVQNW